MTPKEVKRLEKSLPRCKCGGRLYISGYTRDSHPKGLLHLIVRCKKCTSWWGGFTSKEKLKERETNGDL